MNYGCVSALRWLRMWQRLEEFTLSRLHCLVDFRLHEPVVPGLPGVLAMRDIQPCGGSQKQQNKD
jgi:hypothetical protein